MAEFEDRAFIDSLVFPEPTCVLNAPYERQQKAQLIVKRGHAANEAGDFASAAALFFEASGLEPHRNTSIISHLNMRLKLGQADLAVAAYLRILEGRTLSESEHELVRRKLKEANQVMIDTKDEREAAYRLTRAGRATAARIVVDRRRRRLAAATALQRWAVRRLFRQGLGHAGLVSQVVLLRLARATDKDSAAIVLADVSDARLGDRLSVAPSALAPFAALALPFSSLSSNASSTVARYGASSSSNTHIGGGLHFAVTNKVGRVLWCCALAFAEPPSSNGTGSAYEYLEEVMEVTQQPTEVLILVSCSEYQPTALAAAANALLPAAKSLAISDPDAPKSRAARLPRFVRAARSLICQPLLRPNGTSQTIYCEGTAIRIIPTTYPTVPTDAATVHTSTPGVWPLPSSPPPPLPLPPPHCEPLCEALAPLSAEAIVEILTALLLERKIVLLSNRPSRLTSAACALLTLLYPFEWQHTIAPLLPPTHEAVMGMPFPFLLGRVTTTSMAPSPAGNGNPLIDRRPSMHGNGDDALHVHLDQGKVGGDRSIVREPALPEREAILLTKRLQAAIAERERGILLGGLGSSSGEADLISKDGGINRQADEALQSACLSTMASLLAVCLTDEFTTLGTSMNRRSAGPDALDHEITRLTKLYVKRQETDGARDFAAGLVETTHFQRLLEALAQPRAMWSKRLLLFGAWAERAGAEHSL